MNWTTDSDCDLKRLDAFLSPFDPHAAWCVVESLYDAAQELMAFPDLGIGLNGFELRNVRKLVVGDYELRYERTDAAVIVLRIWHVREDR